MRIRSVTLAVNLSWPLDPELLERAGRFAGKARRAFAAIPLEVQTVRLAAQPLPEVLRTPDEERAVMFAQELERRCAEHSIDFASVGTILVDRGQPLEYLNLLQSILLSTERIFASVHVASREWGISLSGIRGAARVVRRVADGSERGFGNLRFAMLANCPSHIPFFPAAYHLGNIDAFSLAWEAADLAVQAFEHARTLEEAGYLLMRATEDWASRMQPIIASLQEEGFEFVGHDISLAPFPDEARSIAHAIERLGVKPFGSAGTLFAAALITNAIRRTRLKKCGFCGLMLPLMEDSTLAARLAQEVLPLESLLLYSAVCGLGLDTVPLPGDVTEEQLASIMLDVATLAVRLDKPLTARLMPIPGKSAGEWTEFVFPYFANTRILPLRRGGAAELLTKGDAFRFYEAE